MDRPQFSSFQAWAPDQGTFGTKQSEEARGVIKTATGYRPFQDLVTGSSDPVVTPSTPETRPTGLFFGKTVAGNAQTFAAIYDPNDSARSLLYELGSDGRWTDATGGGWTVSGPGRFRTAQWEDDLYITNFDNSTTNDGTLRVETLDGSATSFPEVQFTPPVAAQFVQPKFIAVVRDFLVVAHMLDPSFQIDGVERGGLHPDRVRWSAINQPSVFVLEGDPTNLAGFQDLPDAGPIQGIIGGEYATILCENGLFRMDFVGPPATFAFNRIERARGCQEPNSIVVANNVVYYLSDDGWKSFDGQAVQSIGAERWDRWFRVNATQSELQTMSSFVDPNNQLVVWGFTRTKSIVDVNDTLLIYNYALNEPTYAEMDHSLLGAFVTPSLDIESVDTILVEGLAAEETWQGTWQATASYAVDDVVAYFPTPPGGIVWRDLWSVAVVDYVINDAVYLGDANKEDTFRCIQNIPAGEEANYGPRATFRPNAWNPTLVYNSGDTVVENVTAYRATATTTAGEPPSGAGSGDWTAIGDPHWEFYWTALSSAQATYRCIVPVVGASANTPPAYDAVNWELSTVTASIEEMGSIPWDSTIFKPGAQIFGGLSRRTDGDDTLHVFSGRIAQSIIDTTEFRPSQGRTRIQALQAAIEGDATEVTFQLGTRDRLGVPVTWTPEQSINPDGTYKFNTEARYCRARAIIRGDWRDATGIFYQGKPTTGR